MEPVYVDVVKNRPFKEKEMIIKAIRRGISRALKKSKNIVIKVYEKRKEDLIQFTEGSDRFTLVEIPYNLGNSDKKRKNIFNEVAEELKQIGLSNNDIYIMFPVKLPKSLKKQKKK